MTDLDLRMASMPPEGLWSLLLPHVQGLRSESNFFGYTLYHEYLCASSAAVIWLALLSRPGESTRRLALQQLNSLLGSKVPFDPAADEATREKQIERFRERIVGADEG